MSSLKIIILISFACFATSQKWVPVKYSLTLKVDKEDFEGNLRIDIDSLKSPSDYNISQNRIYASGLNITSFNVMTGGQLPYPVQWSLSNGNLLNLTAATRQTGDLIVITNFTGRLSNDLSGFYQGSYDKENNISKRWFGVTQFEAPYARKAFPCFDQPLFRAELALTLIVRDGLTAESNMPQISNETNLQTGWKTIVFETTPRIPTYLMAWNIHDDSVIVLGNTLLGTVKISIIGRKEYKGQEVYAQVNCPKLIEQLELYAGTSYADDMEKLDLIAIPDFAAGAMENWGMITFREEYLLVDEVRSSAGDRQRVLLTVAHELCHHWFGNRLTLESWSFTWLNEAFANYFQRIISEKLEATWRLDEQMVIDQFQASMLEDDSSSHPLTNLNLTTDEDISNMFDTITYDKGASLLKMLSHTLGEKLFHDGIKTYIHNGPSFENVSNPHKLWSSFIGSGDKLPANTTLSEVMNTWFNYSGHPIVVVKRDGNSLVFSQINDDFNSSAPNASTRWVPITYKTGNNVTGSFWLAPTDTQKRITILEGIGNWYLVNLNSTGYYRVNYDDDNWKQLRSLLNTTVLTPVERAQIVNDVLNLMLNNYVNPEIAFELVGFLKNEKDPIVWRSVVMNINQISNYLSFSPQLQIWQGFVRTLLNNAVPTSIFTINNTDTHVERLHKATMINAACRYNHTNCLNYISNLTIASISGAPELMEQLACAKIRVNSTDTSFYKSIYQFYLNSNLANQKRSYLNALTCSNNQAELKKLLQKLMEFREIKQQDYMLVVGRICSTPAGATAVFNFLKENTNKFLSSLLDDDDFSDTIKYLINQAENEQRLEELETFVKETLSKRISVDTLNASMAMGRAYLTSRFEVEKIMCKHLNCTMTKASAPISTSLSFYLLFISTTIFIWTTVF